MTIEEGQKAPPFTLPDDAEQDVALTDFAGRRLVMFFYPRAMTPGCTTQACDFRDRYEVLQGAGVDVVGVSPDKPAANAKFKAEYGFPYPLLSDVDHQVSEAYGAWGIKRNYGKEYEGLIRSTFVIGPDGKVERAYRNVRAKGHVARVLEDLELVSD